MSGEAGLARSLLPLLSERWPLLPGRAGSRKKVGVPFVGVWALCVGATLVNSGLSGAVGSGDE